MVLEGWEGFRDGRLNMGGKKRVSSDSERGPGRRSPGLGGCWEQRAERMNHRQSGASGPSSQGVVMTPSPRDPWVVRTTPHSEAVLK